MTVYLYNKFVFDVKSVQNRMAEFNYFSKSKVNRFINKVINVIPRVMYCLLFVILQAKFETLRAIKNNWSK